MIRSFKERGDYKRQLATFFSKTICKELAKFKLYHFIQTPRYWIRVSICQRVLSSLPKVGAAWHRSCFVILISIPNRAGRVLQSAHSQGVQIRPSQKPKGTKNEILQLIAHGGTSNVYCHSWQSSAGGHRGGRGSDATLLCWIIMLGTIQPELFPCPCLSMCDHLHSSVSLALY